MEEMKEHSDNNSSFIDFNEQTNDLTNKPPLIMKCFARRTSTLGLFIPPGIQLLCYRTINNQKKDNTNTNNHHCQLRNQHRHQQVIDFHKQYRAEQDEGEKPLLDSCIICNWSFPQEMINQERNTHICLCLEGKGKDNIATYLLSKATALLTTQKNNRTFEGIFCIFCNKQFKSSKQNHLYYCARKYLSCHISG